MGTLTEYLGRLAGERWGRTAFIDTGPSAGGSCPRTRAGPLEADYVRPTNRRRADIGTFVQTLVKMKGLYEAGDRAAFDKLVHKFDQLANRIDSDPDDPTFAGNLYRQTLFPEWTPHEV